MRNAPLAVRRSSFDLILGVRMIDIARFDVWDEVRIIAMPKAHDNSFGPPKLGEVGVVVYKSGREGYLVEKVGKSGHIEWTADFLPEQLEAA
jgi:hypothetical protein